MWSRHCRCGIAPPSTPTPRSFIRSSWPTASPECATWQGPCRSLRGWRDAIDRGERVGPRLDLHRPQGRHVGGGARRAVSAGECRRRRGDGRRAARRRGVGGLPAGARRIALSGARRRRSRGTGCRWRETSRSRRRSARRSRPGSASSTTWTASSSRRAATRWRCGAPCSWSSADLVVAPGLARRAHDAARVPVGARPRGIQRGARRFALCACWLRAVSIRCRRCGCSAC